MRFRARALIGVLFGGSVLLCQQPNPHRMRADIRFLSSDLLEGRGPGSFGDTLASEYIRTRFAELGLETSFQAVTYQAQETLSTTKIGQFAWLTEVAASLPGQREEGSFQFADTVFAGHGIVAPEFQWDDYGETVVKGKIVVVLSGEPRSEDPGFFFGLTSTPYSEAEYKFAEAAKRGALGVLIIHNADAANLSWDTVRRRWGGEQFALALGAKPGDPAPMLFEGWVTQTAAQRWLETTWEQLLEEASKPGFRARRLDKRMAGRVASRRRMITTRNVIAVLKSTENAPVRESVLITAHLDGLGVAKGQGDTVYNGAVDNATGVAAMLELARLWTDMNPRPFRGAIFVATAAEEPGAFGAKTYLANPVLPMNLTPLRMDLHGYLPLGRTRDFHAAGAERSRNWAQIRQTFERFGLDVKTIPQTKGPLMQPDPFAAAGVASFTLQPGSDYSSEPARKAQLVEEHLAKRHHTPLDEYSEDWDLSGLEQVVRLSLDIAVTVANAPATAPKTDPVTGSTEN